MAFIPIDAKADVQGSKKGKITPAQHAQFNAWCLASKTGILDCLDKCVATSNSYTAVNNISTVVFKKGYIVICGRIVECEEGTQVKITTPTTGSVTGKIILKYDLSSSEEKEFAVTTKSGDLIQEDLNNNPITGIYEFELYSYTATPTTITLERKNTNYVKSVEQRLNELGFKEGVAEYSGFNSTPYSNSLKKQGKYVIFNFLVLSSALSANATAKIVIPKEFVPKHNIAFIAGVQQYILSSVVPSMATLTINAETGEITIKAGTSEVVNIYIYNIGWETE